MRLSIGHRLFAAVLLAILAVAAISVGLMRQKVAGSFADYALTIELDRLDELSSSLANQYHAAGGWRFLPAAPDRRRSWIADELLRLQAVRQRVPVLPQSEPASPGPHASGSNAPVVPAAPLAATRALPVAPAAPPPPPPAPALPPLPAPVMPDNPAAPDLAEAPLQQRIALFDADGRRLAGEPNDAGQQSARRPIVADGKTIGYLAVTKPLRPSDAPALAFLGQLKSSLAPIFALGVALSALAAMLLAAHFRKPIHRLAAGARELAAGRYDARIDVERSDELGELSRSFNQLAERLAQAEASRRNWVADTSHELRTPLSVLRAQLEAIQDGVRAADRDTVGAMLRQVLALNKLIDELYALARADLGEHGYDKRPLDLWQLAVEEAHAFGDKARAASLAIETHQPQSSTRICADADRLRQVMRNLLENALRYTAAGGKVRLSAHADGATVTLTVDDSAPGVPDEALARLSERFYRVDASRSRASGGAGLGLALCERIVRAHGGTLGFAHSPLGGLRVTVTIPREAA